MKKLRRGLVLLVCIVLGGALLGCGSDESRVKKALDNYIDAYGDMSLEAIHNASFPEGMEGLSCSESYCETDYDFFEYWRNAGFARGSLDIYDYTQSIPDFVVYEDYPLVYEGENGEMVDKEGNQVTIEEAFPDFSISYNVVNMAPFEDCTVSHREVFDLIQDDNMDEIVHLADGGYLDVDDMYVANLQVEWSYGNNLYGYNQDWWDDSTFCENMYCTYEEAIEERLSREHIVFIYKYNDEWYVYPEKLGLSAFLYEAEF